MAELCLVTGKMGGGKSYFGAETALKCAQEGGVVHTNLPMRWDVLEDLGLIDRFRILPNNIRDIVRITPGEPGPRGEPPRDKIESDFLVGGKEGAENLVIIDEASLEFDIDEQMSKGEKERNKPLFQLAALCRHVGLDFYFLAQHEGNVNVKLRRLAARRVHCVKTESISGIGWLLVMLPWAGTFRRKYYQGQEKTPVTAAWQKFDPVVGSIYNTHGMRDGVAIRTDPTRSRGQDQITTRGKAKVLTILAAFACMIGYAMVTGCKLVKGRKEAHTRVAEAGLASPTPSTPAAAKGASSAMPAPAGSPRPAPEGGTLRKREWVEWDTADEVPFLAVLKDGQGLRVQVETGEVLRVGGDFQGEHLVRVAVYGGWYYFWTEYGRVFVARPMTAKERQERRDAIAQRGQVKPGFVGENAFGLGTFKPSSP